MNRLNDKVKNYFLPISEYKLVLPFYLSSVHAGFPSPADDYIEKNLDLNEHLISKPSATFIVKISGDSMKDIGIQNESLIIVDRSKTPQNGSIVLAILEGEFTVKRFFISQGKVILKPENNQYQSIEILEHMDFEIWGVVIHCINSFK